MLSMGFSESKDMESIETAGKYGQNRILWVNGIGLATGAI